MRIRSMTAAAAATMVLAATPAVAVPVLWDLVDVTFDDNTSVAGSFVYNADTDAYSQWNLSVQAWSAPPMLPAYTYDSGDPSNFVGAHDATMADFVALPETGPGRYLRLSFAAGLSNLGGAVALVADPFSFECDNCYYTRYVISGEVIGAPVPEPGTWALFAIGLVGIGAVARRRLVV
ncbi:MAG: PEP-CTERM sorting domain-containing protein [Burkholderiales bacterium]|nr:PEP-CTERM sorting domain-containing protein [Burkholderiales bacterium]